MKKLFALLKSVRLSIILFLLFIVLCIAGTLAEDTDIFHTIVFYVISGVFLLNLVLCTVSGIYSHLDKKSPAVFASDFIHFGVLLVITGMFLSLVFRTDQKIFVSEGSSVSVFGKTDLSVVKLKTERYPDGRVRDWLVYFNGREKPLELNKPLAMGGIKLYLETFSKVDVLVLENGSGELFYSYAGERLELDGTEFIFTGIADDGTAKLESAGGNLRLLPGSVHGDIKVADVFSGDIAGIRGVWDPGAYPAAGGALFILAGFIVLFAFRRKKAQDP